MNLGPISLVYAYRGDWELGSVDAEGIAHRVVVKVGGDQQFAKRSSVVLGVVCLLALSAA